MLKITLDVIIYEESYLKLKFLTTMSDRDLGFNRRLIMWNEIIAYLKDEEGQTSTEYILLVAVVAAVIFKFRTILDEKLTGLVGKVFGKAERDFEF